MAMHKTLADQYSSAVASVAVKALSAAQSSATAGNGTISVLNSDGTRTVIGVGAGTDETGGSVGVATFVGDTTPPGYPTGVSFQTGNGGITGIWAGTLYGGVPSDFDRVAFRVDGEEFGEVNCAGSAQSDALTVGQSYTCDAVAYDVQGNVSDACDAVTVTVRDVTLEAEAAAEAANEAQEAASEALAAAQESASELASQIEEIETSVSDLSTTVSGAVETADEALELATTVETSLTGFEATVSETYATYEYVDEGDDITIGGTNLLPGTRDWSSGLSSATATDEEYGGCVVASYTKSSTTSNFVNLFSYPSVLTEVEGSAAYTLSFWGRADADGVNITSFFYNNASGDIVASCTNSTGNSKNSADGNIVTTLSTEWERHWVTWVTQGSPTPPVSLIPARMLASTTGTVYMAGAKLERGDVPTDWSPAPEDAEDAIADAQADATSALTQVSTLEVTVGEISATVEANYEYAEETYATKAALTETAESITAEVQAVSDTADDALEKATTVATDLAGFEATVEETYATKDEVYDVETAANEANELAATAYAAALASSSGVSYCTCETAAATADKVVDCDGFTLAAGATIIVAFTYANTAGALTMDVNGTGALPVEASGYETSTSNFLLWGAGTEVQFYTDGESWVYAGGATSYVDVCATAADTAAKTIDRDNAVVTAGTRDVVTWTYGASYDEGASTFDLGGTVAQTVWYGDSATSADNPLSLNPGDTIALVYGGSYWFVSESTVLERCASLEVTCDEISATVESNYEYAEGTYATKTEVTETADSILSTVSETYVSAADAETTYVLSSELEQTAESIAATFTSSLSIGGTNILPDTKDFSTWSSASTYVTETDEAGYGVAVFPDVSSASWRSMYSRNYGDSSSQISYSLVRGKTCTLSFDFMAPGGSLDSYAPFITFNVMASTTATSRSAYIDKRGSNWDISTDADDLTSWQRVVYTFDCSDDFFSAGSVDFSDDCGFGITIHAYNTYEVRYRKFKLEIGTVATDYSPAPEDVDQSTLIRASSSGVEVGQLENGSYTGSRSLLSSDGLAIFDEDGDELASFEAETVTLNSGQLIISASSNFVQMTTEDVDGDNTGFNIYSDFVKINADNMITFNADYLGFRSTTGSSGTSAPYTADIYNVLYTCIYGASTSISFANSYSAATVYHPLPHVWCGTGVWTATASTSLAVFTSADFSTYFVESYWKKGSWSRSEYSSMSTAFVQFANGDGSAQSVHAEGATYKSSTWYCVFGSTAVAGSIRINFLVVRP